MNTPQPIPGKLNCLPDMEFKTLPELIRHFSDEKVAWDYLEKQKWDGKPVCPHCESDLSNQGGPEFQVREQGVRPAV